MNTPNLYITRPTKQGRRYGMEPIYILANSIQEARKLYDQHGLDDDLYKPPIQVKQ